MQADGRVTEPHLPDENGNLARRRHSTGGSLLR